MDAMRTDMASVLPEYHILAKQGILRVNPRIRTTGSEIANMMVATKGAPIKDMMPS